MITVVAATILADEFAFGEVLRRRPATEFEAVRRVTDGTDLTIPFRWATAENAEDLPAVVAGDPTIRTVDVLTAVEDDYGVPRKATLADLAADLDVSHQALSERLRRGHATLGQRALDPELTGAPTR